MFTFLGLSLMFFRGFDLESPIIEYKDPIGYTISIDNAFEEDCFSNQSFCQQLLDVNFDEILYEEPKPTESIELKSNLDLRGLENCHATDKIKVETNKGVNKIIGIADLSWERLMNDLRISECDEITLKKLPAQGNKKGKFSLRKIEDKRSIAFADNILRGLALNEVFRNLELKKKDADGNKRATKALSNQFTNYSRKSRGAGRKLEEEFLKRHDGIFKYSTYTDVINFFDNLTIFVFDKEGYIKFLSPKLTEECAYFYEGNDDFYIITNIRGFCRVDN